MLRYGVFASRWPLGGRTAWTIVNRNSYSVTGPQIDVPVRVNGRHWGGFRTGLSLARIDAQLAATTWHVVIAAILLAVVHVRQNRGKALSTLLSAAITVFVVVASVGTIVQVYRIGDSGAQATWSEKPLLAPTSGKS